MIEEPITLKPWPSSEAELCAAVIEIFMRTCDCHSEVLPKRFEITTTETGDDGCDGWGGGSAIDIVLVRPDGVSTEDADDGGGWSLMALEAKLSFNDEVILQAKSRTGLAPFRGVLTPEPPPQAQAPGDAGEECRRRLAYCHRHGIGVYWVRHNAVTGKIQIIKRVEPRRMEAPRQSDLENALCEATRRFNTAGAKTGNESNGGVRRFGTGDRQWNAVREHLRLMGATEHVGSWVRVKDVARDLRLRKTDRNTLTNACRRGAVGGVISREMHGELMICLSKAAETEPR